MNDLGSWIARCDKQSEVIRKMEKANQELYQRTKELEKEIEKLKRSKDGK